MFPYFVAIQNGLASALCTCLLVNGFVGFQLYEDGTTLSVWMLRLSSLGMFVIGFAVSLLTFKSWAGLSPTNTTGLFVVLYVINGICVAVYFIMQFLLVMNTLQDRWPLGDLIFGLFFLVVGQLMLYVFARPMCEGISHYLDGMFFATVCNLLAVMMVYKVCSLDNLWIGKSADKPAVLGFNHKRGPRILRWHQAEELGSQGHSPRSDGRQPQLSLSPFPWVHVRPVGPRC